jgi:deferrochelatase/peroxidase EfeB
VVSTVAVDLADVQGNILRGYRKPRVRHLVLRVVDAAAARRWIGATAGDDRAPAPAITSAAPWDAKPDTCCNIGITFAGLRALKLPASTLDSFPTPYVLGMAARNVKLGDVGASAPDTWIEPFREAERVHLIVSIHADSETALDDVQRYAVDSHGGAFESVGVLDGALFDGNTVHFGYRDNISQPRFAGIHDPTLFPDPQPLAPLGTVLLGHPTAFEGLTWRVPEPVQLGANGAFNALRILAQDTAGFEDFLDHAAEVVLGDPLAEELLPLGAEAAIAPHGTRHDAMREIVAAKLCGRWRDGTSLELSPENPSPTPAVSDTDFDYVDDANGLRCPIGAHTRRCNPRGAKIVQRVANGTRRLVRRGMPYGPVFDRDHPDDVERGLLGNFICADLAAQFESVQYDWLNLGLQHPDLTGTDDPLLGANDPSESRFDIPTASGSITLTGLPRFVRTRGGAYTFLPSLTALRHIGAVDRAVPDER